MSEAERIRAAIAGFAATIDLDVAGGIRLRRVEAADAAALHGQFADWDVVRWLARPTFPVPAGATAAFCAEAATRQAVDGELDLAILVGRVPVGVFTWRLAGQSPVQRAIGSSIGYWLGRAFWGRGIMTAVAREMIGRIFASTEAEAIYSGVFDGNGPSLAIQRKLGFVVDGRAVIWCNPHRDERLHINTRLDRRDFATGRS